MTREFLEVEKISVNYGAVQALEDVSLRVGEGEIVTVIGSNGAGKTTLMKTIAGLLQSRSGAISFEGQGIGALEAHAVVVRGISLVPEGRQVFGRMSVHENLILGAYSRGGQALDDDFERSYQLFPRLHERRDQRAGTLSGGEQQMLAIARGLMSRPRLLLMDEPSLGLAPRLVRETFEVVENLRRRGTTILMVEQMARMALKVSDRAYVLEHGRIVQEGASAELLGDARVLGAYLGAKAFRRQGLGFRLKRLRRANPVPGREAACPSPGARPTRGPRAAHRFRPGAG